MSSIIENKTHDGRRNGKPHAAEREDLKNTPAAVSSPSSGLRPPSPSRGEGEKERPAKKPTAKSGIKRLGVTQQKKFLDWMIQGASPQVACHKLKVSLASFWNTLEHDDRFAAELQRVWDTLSFNVVAALYQAAIKGNGPAQQFWLKHRPPPRWAVTVSELNPADELEAMSDAELLDRARTEAPDLAAEIAARIGIPPGEFPPAGFSEPVDSPGE